jgi:hypothetical protein
VVVVNVVVVDCDIVVKGKVDVTIEEDVKVVAAVVLLLSNVVVFLSQPTSKNTKITPIKKIIDFFIEFLPPANKK